MYNLDQFTARVEIENFHTTLRVRGEARPTRHNVIPDLPPFAHASARDFLATADGILDSLGLARVGDWSSCNGGSEWTADLNPKGKP